MTDVEKEEKAKSQLSGLLKDMLSGTAKLGLGLMPVLASFGKYKLETDWKACGFSAWLESDPEAPAILAKAIREIRDRIPEEARALLVASLTEE